MARISGNVAFTAVPRRVADAVLRIRLLDVSRADASSISISETTLRGVAVTSAEDRFEFALDVPDLDPRHTYALEAHLDVNDTGETSVGDYRTMEHYEVTPETVSAAVTIWLRPVL